MPSIAARFRIRSLATSLCAALVLSFTAISVKAKEQASNDFQVQSDQAHVMRIDEPVVDIIVGNPSIANVTIRSAKLLVVTGKACGVTNVIAFNADDKVIVNRRLVVRADDQKFVGETLGDRACTQTCGNVRELHAAGRSQIPVRIASLDDATSTAPSSAEGRDLAPMSTQLLELSDRARRKPETSNRQVLEPTQASTPAANSAGQHKARIARERIHPISKTTSKKQPKLALVSAPSEVAKQARQATRRTAKRHTVKARRVRAAYRTAASTSARPKRYALSASRSRQRYRKTIARGLTKANPTAHSTKRQHRGSIGRGIKSRNSSGRRKPVAWRKSWKAKPFNRS